MSLEGRDFRGARPHAGGRRPGRRRAGPRGPLRRPLRAAARRPPGAEHRGRDRRGRDLPRRRLARRSTGDVLDEGLALAHLARAACRWSATSRPWWSTPRTTRTAPRPSPRRSTESFRFSTSSSPWSRCCRDKDAAGHHPRARGRGRRVRRHDGTVRPRDAMRTSSPRIAVDVVGADRVVVEPDLERALRARPRGGRRRAARATRAPPAGSWSFGSITLVGDACCRSRARAAGPRREHAPGAPAAGPSRRASPSIVLATEFLVVVSWRSSLFGLKTLPAPVALGGGAALLVVMAIAAALCPHPRRHRARLAGAGRAHRGRSCVQPAVGVVGLFFAAMWTYCMIVGGRDRPPDRERTTEGRHPDARNDRGDPGPRQARRRRAQPDRRDPAPHRGQGLPARRHPDGRGRPRRCSPSTTPSTRASRSTSRSSSSWSPGPIVAAARRGQARHRGLPLARRHDGPDDRRARHHPRRPRPRLGPARCSRTSCTAATRPSPPPASSPSGSADPAARAGSAAVHATRRATPRDAERARATVRRLRR